MRVCWCVVTGRMFVWAEARTRAPLQGSARCERGEPCSGVACGGARARGPRPFHTSRSPLSSRPSTSAPPPPPICDPRPNTECVERERERQHPPRVRGCPFLPFITLTHLFFLSLLCAATGATSWSPAPTTSPRPPPPAAPRAGRTPRPRRRPVPTAPCPAMCGCGATRRSLGAGRPRGSAG